MVCGKTGWNGLCAVVLAAVFSLTLAGCGGGGSTTAPPVVDTSLADAKAAAKAAYDAAKKALDDVMENKDADMASYDAAAAQVAAAKSASDQAGAAETAEAAQLAQRLAERAKAEAERYAAMVTAAQAAADLQAVKDAAMAAYDAAKKALADVKANKDADADSYAAAEEKVEAAKAANDEAQLAETLADAQAAKDDAEKAKTETEKYTGMVKSASDVAAQLAAAKAAAKAAYDAAKKALDDVMADKDADTSSYDTAAAQVAAAKAASDKAQEAKTLEAAQAAKELAETARDEAEKYAGMVKGKHTAGELADAKAAAMKAHEAATEALSAHVKANKDADMTSYDTAVEKLAAAKAANDAAQAAETPADAQAAQMNAETARDEAVKYAGMVMDAARSKGAEGMEKAIDGLVITYTAGEYGHNTYANNPSVDNFNREVIFTYNASQRMEKAELPASLELEGFEGQLHVRTTEDKATGQIVRDKAYFWTDIGPDTQTSGSGIATVDPNSIEFGFWLQEIEKDGVITYNKVQPVTFLRAGQFETVIKHGELTRIEGEATYSGPAVGAYFHKTTKTDGTLDRAGAGTFTADVSLMAKFGGSDIAANEQFSVSGAVSNFTLSGGQENSWNLKLDAEDINEAANYTSTHAFKNGTTAGGGRTGTWSGVFVDDEDSTSNAVRTASDKKAPGYMTGKFRGYFLNGSVGGVFGLKKETE